MKPSPIDTWPIPHVDPPEPIPVLLFCPVDLGWAVGVWWENSWHLAYDFHVILNPTHWARLPDDPSNQGATLIVPIDADDDQGPPDDLAEEQLVPGSP